MAVGMPTTRVCCAEEGSSTGMASHLLLHGLEVDKIRYPLALQASPVVLCLGRYSLDDGDYNGEDDDEEDEGEELVDVERELGWEDQPRLLGLDWFSEHHPAHGYHLLGTCRLGDALDYVDHHYQEDQQYDHVEQLA
jgi:hypothetical protein